MDPAKYEPVAASYIRTIWAAVGQHRSYGYVRRKGGADGQSRFIDADDEDSALDIARDLMIGRDGWRDLS